MIYCCPSTLCVIIIFCEARLGFRSLPIQTLKKLLVAEAMLIIIISHDLRENKENLIFHFWSQFYYQGYYSFLEALAVKHTQCTERDMLVREYYFCPTYPESDKLPAGLSLHAV